MAHEVVFVAHPKALGMELLGAMDVLRMADDWLVNLQGREPLYRIHLTCVGGGALPLWGGTEIASTVAVGDYEGPVDTLVVTGGHHAHEAAEDPQYIADNPGADLSLTRLAARVRMSPRHFARVFRAEVGTSPGRYVERVRLETARRWLESTDQSVEQIAAASGFGSAETLRRVFHQRLSVSPAEYRRTFGTAARPRSGHLVVMPPVA